MILIPGFRSQNAIQFLRYDKDSMSLYKKLQAYFMTNTQTTHESLPPRKLTTTWIHPLRLFSTSEDYQSAHIHNKRVLSFNAAWGFSSSQKLVVHNSNPKYSKKHLQSVKLSASVADILKAWQDTLVKKVIS